MTKIVKETVAALVYFATVKRDEIDRQRYGSELTISFVRYHADGTEGCVRNYSSTSYGMDPAPRYADLVIHDWLHSDRTPYGATLEYRHVFSVNATQARAMARTLETLHKQLDKLREAEGSAADLPAQVNRILRAMRVKVILRRTGGAGLWHSDTEYTPLSLSDGDYHLRSELERIDGEFRVATGRAA